MFSPFGDIENIELPRDHVTGKNLGHCVIQFVRHRDAKEACKAMDGENLNEVVISVKIVTEKELRKMEEAQQENLDEDNSKKLIQSAQARSLLMQNLSRDKEQL